MKCEISRGRNALLVLLCLVFLFSFSQYALGKVGVGMGAGEIRITEEIKPGGIYSLPNLRVFNTGDETTTYGMNIAYHQNNPELRPEKSWFTFTPATFTVEPGESQEVQVAMFVPVKTDPGDYFAFVESGPVALNGPGTSVGVAVATKLFNVVHANLWQAILYRSMLSQHTTVVGLPHKVSCLFLDLPSLSFLIKYFSTQRSTRIA
jgi:hypothetical protein